MPTLLYHGERLTSSDCRERLSVRFRSAPPGLPGEVASGDRRLMSCVRSRDNASVDGGSNGGQQDGRREVHTIPLGAKGAFTLLVTPEHLANRFKDSILPPVLATPLMILAMENAALNAIRSYLEPGESAVGTAVDVRHIAATPAGQRVTAEAEVTLVEDRRIVFAVTARDEIEEIGSGTHERMVVDLQRIARRLEAKRRPR